VKRAIAVLIVFVVLVACADQEPKRSADGGPTIQLTIAIDAPYSGAPYVARGIEHGVELAVDQINERGGIQTRGGTFTLAIKTYDNELSPQRALQNVRRAIDDDSLVIVSEGTGVDAFWEVAEGDDVPVGIVYQGGVGLVDLEQRPNVFRIAPTDHGVAFRLAEYLVPKGLKIAFLHDDSGYGVQGKLAFDDPFGYVPEAVAADIQIPSDSPDYSPQVLKARRSDATALLVWGTGSTIAKVVRNVRSSGWDVPIYTPPAGGDPLVRQQLADHPEWVEGLTFASGRMMAEVGPGPFLKFRAAYEDKFGKDEVGVKTSTGQTVYQPPEYPMYPYDFVNVLAAAIEAAGSGERADVLAALEQVAIKGANGDERGFNEKNHEGVVDDDVYFAVFHDMMFAPVDDDPLSASLEVISQTDE
jgi:ABC-type branched-subunit amino acid transport system substrate-binding protein